MSHLIKRIIDIVVSITVLVLLSPILLLVGVLILLLEGRPIFYVSERHKSPTDKFKIFKFRAMVKDANNEEKYKLYEKYYKGGFLDIPVEAEVYTPLGRILERTQLVEVPQFYNVLCGEMSIVGNRPLPTKNIKDLQKHPNWKTSFESPPGITGITQVVGKLSLDPETRIKLESLYSLVYKEGNIVLLDIIILYRTIMLLLFGKNISVDKAISLLNKMLKKSEYFDARG